MFSRNIGNLDRAVRIIVGLALIALALFGEGMLWGWIGIVPLITAVIGFCPAYRLLGLSTLGLKGH